jgi:hypothetical protein
MKAIQMAISPIRPLKKIVGDRPRPPHEKGPAPKFV